MKRLLVIILCLGLLLLSGCGEEDKKPSSSDGESDAARRRLGLGAVSTTTMHNPDTSRVKITVAAVVLDTNGRIADCVIDELDYVATLKDGIPQPVADLTTKGERGDRYQPTTEDVGENGDTATPWYEQAEEFCEFVEGKTPAEVSALAATDGKSTQIEGCDLILTDFILAVRRAGDAAVAADIRSGDDLQLAVTATRSPSSGEERSQYDVEMAAVTLDSGDRITGCITDTLEAKLTVTDGAFTTVSGEIRSKREMGDAYGMKKASGIQREWYEQANAFGTYAHGKTAAQLAGLPLADNGKTDAVAGCTIDLRGMLQNAVKAARDD